MRVILLLAGRSRRFWPLADKALFPLCGKTLLEHQIDRLKEAGCTDILLVGGGHNLEAAKTIVPDLPIIEQENLDLGMQGALLSALPHCSGPVMVVSSNDVVESHAYRAVKDAASHVSGGAILARTVDRYFPGGYLTVEGERVTGIIEKPGEGREPSSLVNIVIHAHNDAATLLAALQSTHSDRDDGYEAALQTLLAQKEYVAVPYEGFWQPVKYPWHFLPLLARALQGLKEQTIHPSVKIHPTAVVEGPVVLEEGVKVLAHATIVGPATLGKRSVIATGSLVRQSSIGSDCVVGYATEVKGSVLSDHVWTHMTYLGDSVIGSNVAFGAGTVTGNYRLDEGEIVSHVEGKDIPTGLRKFGTVVGSDSRVGIHVTINPGVKIGSGTFVSSAAVLQDDIPDKSFVTMKDGSVHVRLNRTTVARPEEKRDFLQKAFGKDR